MVAGGRKLGGVSYDTKTGCQMTTTSTEYKGLETAYDFLNRELLGGQLSPCLITLQRKARSSGYYSPKAFSNRNTDGTTDEISLNPAHFDGRSDEEILSVLVHEMVHKYQVQQGRSGNGRYHDSEWAEMMEECGLMPSSTGQPGGKKTGHRVFHYIIKGGRFQLVCKRLLDSGFKLNWESQNTSDNTAEPSKTKNGTKHKARAEAKKRSKTRFTCPGCGQNAWAKPSARLVCGVCLRTIGIIVPMVGELPVDDRLHTPLALPIAAHPQFTTIGFWN